MWSRNRFLIRQDLHQEIQATDSVLEKSGPLRGSNVAKLVVSSESRGSFGLNGLGSSHSCKGQFRVVPAIEPSPARFGAEVFLSGDSGDGPNRTAGTDLHAKHTPMQSLVLYLGPLWGGFKWKPKGSPSVFGRFSRKHCEGFFF